MASFKLYYFNQRGNGEVSRLLLAASGRKWEDIRFSHEEWPKYKPNAPLGQVPYLEYQGQTFCQSVAIANFLSREIGYYGKNNMDAAVIDQVVQTVQEILTELRKIRLEKDEAKKDELAEKFKAESVPKYLGFFQKLLKKNRETGYFVCQQLSLADLAVYDLLATLKERVFLSSDAVDKGYPAISKMIHNVESKAEIKNYLDAQAALKK